MKRLLTLAAMFLCCMATTFAQFSGSGSGTENDPYLVMNPIQLNQLRNYLDQSGVYFKLMADIDLTEYLEDENPSQGWQPVGSSSAAFKGIVDGNGKTVSGLWLNRDNTDYVGFFGNTDGAIIKDLKIISTSIVGKNYVGGMSGYSKNSTFRGCSFSGEILGNTCVGGYIGGSGDNMVLSDNLAVVKVTAIGDNIGGFLGKNDAGSNLTISNCVLDKGKIVGVNYVGGCCGAIVGDHSNVNSIINTFIYADISGNDYVGGLCGYSECLNHTVNLNSCGYDGRIEATSYVGGLLGYNKYSWRIGAKTGKLIDNIQNSFAGNSIKAEGNYVGGLIGYDEGYWSSWSTDSYDRSINLNDSFFYGLVIGCDNVGGLVGYKNKGVIFRCYAICSVAGGKIVGGLVGKLYNATLKTSVAINTRVSATEGTVNRAVGMNEGTISAIGSSDENKSYNRTIVINQGVAQEVADNQLNGTGVSLTTLKLKATYVAMGFDFTNIWEIQETECYPYMKTQTAPPVITSQVVSGATTISGKCVDGGTITLEIDGVRQQMESSGNNFSFTVSPLQAGHEVRISAKAEGKEQSYFTTATVAYLGSGTEADPYQVYTAADLTGVYRKGYFKLMNDIDLTSYINQYSPTEGWESIGREGSETIHFDGNGHKITGLWCNSTRDNTGLFSCFANGTIKNLTVKTANGKQVKGGANTGVLIGKMIDGTIENCCVSGTIADGTPVGGMVGLFTGGSISRCQANVTISTTLESSYVGGLVGEISGGTIDQCTTTGTLTATGSESCVGGLIGKNYATVSNCFSSATITSSYNAAGLVAYNYGIVEKSYATGNLYSQNYAAGVIGYNDGENAVVRNCAAMNYIIDVTYESQQQQQGGGYGQRIIGGIKNSAPAPEMNNYALKTMQVSVNDVTQKVYDDIMNGTAKTDEELKNATAYQTLGWDFEDTWSITAGESYPTLKNISENQESGNNEGGNNENNQNNENNGNNDPSPQQSVTVTDISQLDNVMYIDPMEAIPGNEAVVSIKMKNSADIRGFQFDLYLPEGVTAVKSSKGKIQGTLTAGRLPDEDEHTLTFSEQSDGSIRFLCSSQYDETFTGNDGVIATLRVNVANDMEDGEYAIQMKNMKLTETDISKFYEASLIQTKLTIISYTLGDINGDGAVDVSDYTGVANHIHGNTPEGFILKAADVDESGTIDVSDYTGIANIIHTGSIYGNSSSRRLMVRQNDVLTTNTDISGINNVIYISPFTATAGAESIISIKMKNNAEIRGFQFDLYLPDGMTVVKSNKGKIQGALSEGRLPDEDEHTLTFSEQPNGAIRFLCSSQYDETFTGNDGEIATLRVNVDNNMTAGDHAIRMESMKLTETDISKFYTTDLVETTVTVQVPGDGRVVLDETSTTAPEDATGVDVRVLRTINANEWSTICLPFAMTAAQVESAFGDDVELADFNGCDATLDTDENTVGLTVNFTDVTTIEANHPYIIKVSSNITEFTVDDVDIVVGDELSVDKDEWRTGSGTKKDPYVYHYNSLVGTYVANTTVPDLSMFLSDNKFWYSTGNTKMKGFRAYFDFYDVLTSVESASTRIYMSISDETTGIKNVQHTASQINVYYDMLGRKVLEPQKKGLYIINGKKVVK